MRIIAQHFLNSRAVLALATLSLVLFIAGCEEPVPDGRIMVRNDTDDTSYNIVNVSGGGAYFSLKPGEHRLLPKGTELISFSRAYAKYTRSYKVRCPARIGSGIRIRLIDVHMNKMPAGCETIEAGKN